MKKNVSTIITMIIFLLTACGGAPPTYVSTTDSTPAIEMKTAPSVTSSPLPSRTPRERPNRPTVTPLPTTPLPPTPLPTIPTFTSTFDAHTIVTVTSAAEAECPKEDPSVVAKFATPDSNSSYEIYRASDILDYLNSGGTLAQLEKSGRGKIVDLTGDGVNEVGYGDSLFGYSILGCKDGKYQGLLDFSGDSGVDLAGVDDLNKNGIPEIILYNVVHYGYFDISVFEWDGNKFRSLIDMGRDISTDPAIDWVSTTDYHLKLIDTNGDGLKEIVAVYDVNKLCGGFGGFCDGTPLRVQTVTLSWNGQIYVPLKQDNAALQYRFQAIQDGDLQARYGSYAEALSFYQAAIFDDRLEWWSPKREEYERRTYWTQYDPTPTVYPTAILDSTEYPRLAAYAYYRIILLHIVQGHVSDAGTVYKTLRQKFSDDPYGHPYVEMATAFWESYQSTREMYDGCAAAIEYAEEHPEILIPLGSDYHGWQSHTYVPTDVCPFR